MDKKLLVTVDVEQDISKYLSNSFLGITEGMPFLLDLFKEVGILGTFFTQGLICDIFPEVIEEIKKRGHSTGCHGYYHVPYGERTRWDTRRDVSIAIEAIRRVSGEKPVMFRAVEFSLTRRLVRVLEDHCFLIDSSALNNYRTSSLWGLTRKRVQNIKEEPYFLLKGRRPNKQTSILEVPVTENPRLLGTPIGAGFLNSRGVEATKAAMTDVRASYCTFLIHPWEVVDFPAEIRNLPAWVRRISKRGGEALTDLLGWAVDNMASTDFQALTNLD